MSLSEIFIVSMPLAWAYVVLGIARDVPFKKFAVRWVLMVGACLVLGVVMVQRINAMMGGKASLAEGLYYGWMLAGLLAVLQLVKKGLRWAIDQTVRGSANMVRTGIRKALYWGLLFMIMVPFFLAMTSVHRCKAGDALDPKSALGLEFDHVSWKTSDGLTIRGWFVPAASDQAVMIAHGLGANKSNFIGTVELWHQMGFNVLIFDFRGHGASDGHTVSFGYHERQDIIGGLDYLAGIRKFTSDRITGYGVSFGGAAMIHAAAQTRGFHRLIIDSSFADLDALAAHIVEGEPIVPPFLRGLFKEIGLLFIRLDLGFDIREKSPENAVAALKGIPVFFIHGKSDPLISWTQSQRLFERATEPKRIFILNSQGHFGTFNDPGYPALIASILTAKGAL